MTAAVKTHDHFALPVQVINARVTYKNAPIHLLEKFTFKDIESAHKAFISAGVDECVILLLGVFRIAHKHRAET